MPDIGRLGEPPLPFATTKVPRNPAPSGTDGLLLRNHLFWYQFSFLKRHSQKSLPSSLFQREESFSECLQIKDSFFSPFENYKGDEGGFDGFSKS